MLMRLTGTLLSFFCAWILWEKTSFYNPGPHGSSHHLVNATGEMENLAECKEQMQSALAAMFETLKKQYGNSEFAIHLVNDVIVQMRPLDKGGDFMAMKIKYSCLTPTMDPHLN